MSRGPNSGGAWRLCDVDVFTLNSLYVIGRYVCYGWMDG